MHSSHRSLLLSSHLCAQWGYCCLLQSGPIGALNTSASCPKYHPAAMGHPCRNMPNLSLSLSLSLSVSVSVLSSLSYLLSLFLPLPPTLSVSLPYLSACLSRAFVVPLPSIRS